MLFVVDFPTTPLLPSWKDAFQAHWWQKLSFSSPIFIPRIYLLLFISSGGIVMLLSSTNHLVLSRSCNFSFLIRLAGVSCFHSSSFILSSFPSSFSRNAAQIISILFLLYLILTGVSSKCFYFAKFKFYSFHFQSERCRN